MNYEMVDNHGSPLGEWDDRDAAIDALRKLVGADPISAYDVAILAFDEDDKRCAIITLNPSDLDGPAVSHVGLAPAPPRIDARKAGEDLLDDVSDLGWA